MSDDEIPVDELREIIDDKEDAADLHRIALLIAAARPLVKRLAEHPELLGDLPEVDGDE